MTSLELSTIAQLLYIDAESVDFARIVAELDAVLTRMRGKEIVISWDCDDLVTFDVPETRILLAWSETGRRSLAGCLTVSVGPSPMSQTVQGKAEHDVLCSRLVERIQGRFQPLAVLWRQVEGAVGADQVDEMVDNLPQKHTQVLPPVDSILEALSRADQQLAESRLNHPHPRAVWAAELSRIAMPPVAAEEPVRTPVTSLVLPRRKPGKARPAPSETVVVAFPEAANDLPHLPLPKNAELARLRDALYPAVEEQPEAPAAAYSTQMRLAAHAMNATLIVVYAPLGAAVMTYSLLKGEDMRLSARVMALAGTFLALANSPIGATMAAVARSIS